MSKYSTFFISIQWNFVYTTLNQTEHDDFKWNFNISAPKYDKNCSLLLAELRKMQFHVFKYINSVFITRNWSAHLLFQAQELVFKTL